MYMPRKHPFTTGQFYHVYNRGVDKRLIFMKKVDYERFLFTLEKFNISDPVHHVARDHENHARQRAPKKKTDPLVKIHAYCLMPNHYHLVLEQLTDNGISKFLQKVMTGYTHYFNLKYERSGVLFQGKSKSRLVDNDDYFRWLSNYLAMNPLDLCEPKWKENGIKDKTKAREFLEKYPWQSDFDYSDFEHHMAEFKRNEGWYAVD